VLALALLGDRLAKLQYPQHTTMQRVCIPVVDVGKEFPASAANFLKFICLFFSRYTQYVGVFASLRYKIMRP
jgi:hypothetical protein